MKAAASLADSWADDGGWGRFQRGKRGQLMTDGNMGSWHPGGPSGPDRELGKLSAFGWGMVIFSVLAFGGLIFLGIYLR